MSRSLSHGDSQLAAVPSKLSWLTSLLTLTPECIDADGHSNSGHPLTKSLLTRSPQCLLVE